LGINAVFTSEEFARLLGISVQAVNGHARAGVITKTGRSCFPLSAITEYCEHLRTTIQNGGAGRGLTQQREEYVEEKTKLARMQRLQAEGKLVDIDQVGAGWNHLVAQIRTRMMAIPNRVAARWAMIRAPHEAEREVRTEIEEALTDCADWRDEIDPSIPPMVTGGSDATK
jgi:phage terminase Nu1 subunit (DNA packaging protein)